MSSSYAVYTGVWVNWSHGIVKGATLTLSARDGTLLLSFIAAFVTVVGGQLWKIISFIAHQTLVKRGRQDGLHFQQRNLLRNGTSPAGAAWTLLLQAWYWRGRASWSFMRSVPWALLAGAYIVVFGVLAVFSSQVSKSAGGERLIEGQQCGIWTPRIPFDTLVDAAYSEKNSKDSREADTYARACYNTSHAPPQCDILPRTTLAHHSLPAPSCPFDQSICLNNTVFGVESELLDSHYDFGINAAPDDRVQYRRRFVCAPLVSKGYGRYLTLDEAEQVTDSGATNDTFIDYSYGPLLNMTIVTQNYTYRYNTWASHIALGYSMTAHSWAPDTNSTTVWYPIPELRVDAGEVDLLLIAANGIWYHDPVDDPVFAAHREYNMENSTADKVMYLPDRFVAPVGCVTKHQICNPVNQKCTPEVSGGRLFQEGANLDLSQSQYVNMGRILVSLPLTGIQASVSGRGSAVVRAQDVVTDEVSLSLSVNQWEIEVSAWFQNALVRLQHLVQEYATGPSSLAPGSYLLQPWNRSTVREWNESDTAAAPYWASQCGQQRTRDAQGTVSFSVLGLIIIFAVGGFLLLSSLCIETVVEWVQRVFGVGEYHRLAWILDSNFQLQRMLSESTGAGTWYGHTNAIPTTSQKETFESFDHYAGARSPQEGTQHEEHGFLTKEPVVEDRPVISYKE